jgi:hypothetical protein
MNTSSDPATTAAARSVGVTDGALVVELRDGRVISVPLVWYPRLAEGSPRERKRWELLGPGIGIHWPELDEDISVEGLLAGARSGESATSLDSWRARRDDATNQRRKGPIRARGDHTKTKSRSQRRVRLTTGR